MQTEITQLRFFQTLMKTRSLTTTANRFEMSQSTANRTLDRLRKLFNDPLFIKTGHGMTPTAHAEKLSPRVSVALEHIENLFLNETFSLEQIERKFRIGAGDNGVFMILPDILDDFFASASESSIDICPLEDDLYKQLEDGRMDLAIYPNTQFPSDFHEALLYESELVHLIRQDHPLAVYAHTKKSAPLEEIHRYPKIEADFFPVTRAHYINLFDKPSSQKTALRIPYFQAAGLILERTDMTLLLPRFTAEALCQRTSLVTLQSDPPQQKFHTRIIWHHRVHQDPAITWLRNLFIKHSKKPAHNHLAA